MMYFTETEALRELEILMQMIPGFQPNRPRPLIRR